MLLASVGDFISRTRPSAVEARPPPERRRQVARRPREGGRPIWSRLTRGRRGDMLQVSRKTFFLATRRRRRRSFFPDGPCLSPQNELKPRPQLRKDHLEEVSSPGIWVDTAHTRERQHRAPPRRRPPLPAVRPAGPGGWRRPGRLHAPEAARTGPVSASRRSHVLMPRGGAGSTEKWPLTGFLAGESPNQTWGAMLTDLNGHKAVKQIAATLA